MWTEEGGILMKEESFIRVVHPLRRLLEGGGEGGGNLNNLTRHNKLFD